MKNKAIGNLDIHRIVLEPVTKFLFLSTLELHFFSKLSNAVNFETQFPINIILM